MNLRARWIAPILRLSAFATAAVLMSMAGAVGWAGYLAATGNVHTVEAGSLYRSGTLPPEQLAQVIQKHGIKAVLNLRGAHPEEEWYRQESKVVSQAGAMLLDLPLSASQEPDSLLMSSLLNALVSASHPLLIHCRSGADRTGLASALYELVVKHQTADDAASQLSFWYGHFPWLGSPTDAMDRAFWRVGNQL